MHYFHTTQLATKVSPSLASNGLPIPGLYDLRLQYKPGGRWELFSEVYLPKDLLPQLMESRPNCYAIEVLGSKDLIRRFLPMETRYMVLGSGTREGAKTNAIPMRLRFLRAGGLIIGGCTSLTSLGLYWQGSIWLGTAALLLGSHLMRTVWPIPSTSHLNFKWFYR